MEPHLQPQFEELIGIAAAAASLYAAQSKTIIPLRAAAIAARSVTRAISIDSARSKTGFGKTVIDAILVSPPNSFRFG